MSWVSCVSIWISELTHELALCTLTLKQFAVWTCKGILWQNSGHCPALAAKLPTTDRQVKGDLKRRFATSGYGQKRRQRASKAKCMVHSMQYHMPGTLVANPAC